jgi:hypothetical protein
MDYGKYFDRSDYGVVEEDVQATNVRMEAINER